MKEVKINKHTLLVYSSIDEIPIINFHKYNKYLMFDSYVGSSVADVYSHINKAIQLIDVNANKAKDELLNLLSCISMIENEVSPKHMAFIALVHSIDGDRITDYSDENIKKIIHSINTVKESLISRLLLEIKKKIQNELELYFPKIFDGALENTACNKMYNRIFLQLNHIIYDKDYSKEISAIDRDLLNLYFPKTFINENSAEIQYDKQFENACLLISQKSSLDVHSMTTLQFYIVLDTIKTQIDFETKAYKQNGKR